MDRLLYSMGMSLFILLWTAIIFGIFALYAYITIEMQGVKQFVAVAFYWFAVVTAIIFCSSGCMA